MDFLSFCLLVKIKMVIKSIGLSLSVVIARFLLGFIEKMTPQYFASKNSLWNEF